MIVTHFIVACGRQAVLRGSIEFDLCHCGIPGAVALSWLGSAGVAHTEVPDPGPGIDTTASEEFGMKGRPIDIGNGASVRM